MGHTLPHHRVTSVKADQWRTTTSAHLRGRARQYRLAAAVADCPRDVIIFCDLAMMFDRLAYDFKRFEHEKRQTSVGSEVAHRGTLFLDEVADLSVAAQAKILRVLQAGEIQRIGAERPIVTAAPLRRWVASSRRRSRNCSV